VDTYRQIYGIDAKIARVFTTYGPRMKLFEGQLIPDFIINALEGKDLAIYGDETLVTTLCYINDTVDGLVRLMGADPEVKVVNLGGDLIISYVEVAQKIIELTNSTSKVVFEKPLEFLTKKGLPDLSYVKDVLGWLPLTRLQDGLQKTIDYTVANKEALLFHSK
jgi:UDP-glucuronate decarboxylase